MADVAYPGQMFPQISEAVAAVHIEKVDRANTTVTIEVNIIAPASMGGTACEVEALRATEVLRLSGAVCIQNGCTYDGVAQVYMVSVMATFTGVTDSDSCTIWPGFYCYFNDEFRRFCVCFTSVETTGAQAEYVMGEAAPRGSSTGSTLWEIRLEELIPSGSPEVANPEGEFSLRVVSDQKTEVYSGCRWEKVTREFSKQGLRRVQEGFALSRVEV